MNVRYITMALAIFAAAPAAQAQTPAPQTITAECTTKETGADGARHGCDSQVSRLTAPDGFVYAVNTAAGGETSGAGSEHSCSLGWADWVEIIPGSEIKQPRTVTLSSHARGPKGHLSGRGWAKCSYTIKLSKYTTQ